MNTFDLHKDRRRFMKMMAVAAGTPMMANLMQSAYAAGPYNDYRALVCVFLFGGNDAHNMIIPLGAEHTGYLNGRGNLAIPAANVIPVSAGISGRTFGFHPSMPGWPAFSISIKSLPRFRTPAFYCNQHRWRNTTRKSICLRNYFRIRTCKAIGKRVVRIILR